jgi:hypothetical protein
VLSGDFVIVALHDYVPALPWMLYLCTQAIAHIWFMRLFARKMRRYRSTKTFSLNSGGF